MCAERCAGAGVGARVGLAFGDRAGLVVFTDARSPSLLRLLPQGFQHCFTVLRAGDRFVKIDSRLNMMQAELLSAEALDWQLRLWRAGGATILALPDGLPRPAPPRRLGLPVFTCVECVKRLIGLDDRRVWLPSQLARVLLQEWLATADNVLQKRMINRFF
jgi:hypothetical protein